MALPRYLPSDVPIQDLGQVGRLTASDVTPTDLGTVGKAGGPGSMPSLTAEYQSQSPMESVKAALMLALHHLNIGSKEPSQAAGPQATPPGFEDPYKNYMSQVYDKGPDVTTEPFTATVQKSPMKLDPMTLQVRQKAALDATNDASNFWDGLSKSDKTLPNAGDIKKRLKAKRKPAPDEE